MKTTTTSASALATAPVGPSLVEDAYGALAESFEQFCLMAGIESLTQMMNEDVARLAGDRYEHCPDNEPPRVWRRVFCSKLRRRDQEHLCSRRRFPPLLAAADSQ